MSEIPTIAVVTASEAFGAIVVAVLARPGWRVRHFKTTEELRIYAGIAPLSVVVCDHDLSVGGPVPAVLSRFKQDARTEVRIILTTRAIAGWTRQMCTDAGIDEVLLKPFSPVHLAERVASQMQRTGHRAAPQEVKPLALALKDRLSRRERPARRRTVQTAGNVVVLADWRKQRHAGGAGASPDLGPSAS